MAESDPLALLRSASSSLTTTTSLSSDGKTLTIQSQTFPATDQHRIEHNDKSCTYTLASMYLQIIDPERGLMQYRKECEKYCVEDPVKPLHKSAVVGFFLGDRTAPGGAAAAPDEGGAAAAGAPSESAAAASAVEDQQDDEARMEPESSTSRPPEKKERKVEDEKAREERKRRERKERERRKEKERRSSSGEHRHHRDRKEKDRSKHRGDRERDKHGRHHRDKSDRHRHDKERSRHGREDREDRDKRKGGREGKTAKAPMTNEQLMQNLNIVVDKRSQPSAKGKEGGIGEEHRGEGEGPTLDSAAEDQGQATAGGDGESKPADGSETTEQQSRRKEPTEEEQRALLRSCLSSAGFEVDPAALESDRDATAKIMALEIPVGDSASILRAGAGGERVSATTASGTGSGPGGSGSGGGSGGGGPVVKRDFSRVLDLYNEVLKAEERMKKGGGGKRGAPPPPHHDPKRRRPGAPPPPSSARKEPKGKPIIIVPNAMTSPITMINSSEFFGKALFVPRDVQLKKGIRKLPSVTISRKISARQGGHQLEYEIIDNPTTRLRPNEWDRVVAVLAQGAAWQFKGWRYSNPVDLFSRVFGFYIGMEGAPVPKELLGWNVKRGMVNRDKRGLDRVTYANFWNGLDEWVALRKPEYLPANES